MPLAGVGTDVQLGFPLVVYAILFSNVWIAGIFPGSKQANALPFSDA